MEVKIASEIEHLKTNIEEFIKIYNEENFLGNTIILNLKPIFKNIQEVLLNIKDSLDTAFFDKNRIRAYLRNTGEEEIKEGQVKLTKKGGYVQDVFLISNYAFETLPDIIENLQIVIAEEKKEEEEISRARKKIKKMRIKEKREAKVLKNKLEILEEEEENRIRNLENVGIKKLRSSEKRLHNSIIDLYKGHKKFYKKTKRIYNKSLELLESLRELNKKIQTQKVEFAQEIDSLIIDINVYTKEIQEEINTYKRFGNLFDAEIENLRRKFKEIAVSVGAAA